MQKTLSIIKNHFSWIFLMWVITCIFFSSFNFGGISWFIDQGFPYINIDSSAYNSLFLWWDKRSFGENQFVFLLNIFEYSFYYIFIKLGLPYAYAYALVKFLLIILVPLGLYVNIKILAEQALKKRLSCNYYWIIAFLPIFSLGFFNEEWHYLFSQRFDWIVALFIFFFLNKYLYLKKWLVWLALLSFLSIFAFNLFPFFLVFHLFIFFYLVLQVLLGNICLRKVLFLYAIYGLLTTFAWFNLLYLYTHLNLEASSSVEYANDLKYYVTEKNHMDNLFRWVFHLIWGWTLWWDASTETFQYQKFFSSGLGLVLGFYQILTFLVMCVYTKLSTKAHKHFLLLFICVMLVSLFISKWNNAPFGWTYLYALEKVSLLNIYRSPANKFMPLFYTAFSFAFLILFVNLSERLKKRIGASLLVIMVLFSVPVLTSWIYSNYSFFNLPGYYLELRHFLQEFSGRTLFLPERSYWKKFDFNALVNSINYFNIPNTTFDIGQTLMSDYNVKWNKKLLDSVNFFGENNPMIWSTLYQRGKNVASISEIDYKEADEQLLNAKIDFVIFDKWLTGTFDPKVISPEEVSYYNYLLDNLPSYHKIRSIWKFEIYKKDWELFGNNIFDYSSAMMSLSKSNPTKYEFQIKVREQENLEMISSYDDWWKIYLDESRNNLLFDLKYLITEPLFSSQHHIAFGYANGWTLGKSEVEKYVDSHFGNELKKEGYPKKLTTWWVDYKYYTLNADWSIDVRLVLYYKPQLYFYLVFLISLSSLLITIFCLVKKRYAINT